MFSFCCYPSACNIRRSLHSPKSASFGIGDSLPTKCSEKSLESVMLQDMSIDRKLPHQSFHSDSLENIDLAKGLRRSATMESHATNSGIKYSTTYAPVPMTKILPHMYLGSFDNAMDEFELKAKGITHILSLTGRNWALAFVEQEAICMHDLGRTNLKDVLKKIFKFVEKGQQDKNNILVHCQSGQNRSATVVISHLMIYHKETLYRAHKRVKRLRPIVQINEGYAKQLLALEKEIFGRNSLPLDWMKRGEMNMVTGEVVYKHEMMNSAQHRVMFDADEQ